MTDAELVQITTDFRSGILEWRPSDGACFMVCAPLFGYLMAFHLFEGANLIEGDLGDRNHFWIELPDGRVLDPTADQFNFLFPDLNLPTVYLGPPTKIHPAPNKSWALPTKSLPKRKA